MSPDQSTLARPPSALAPMVRKLQLWKPLNDRERSAVLSLPYEIVSLQPGDHIVREGSRSGQCCLLIEGFAYRMKLTRDGGRSINAVQMPGDVVDLQNSLLGQADHNVLALTRCRVVKIPREAVIALAFTHPNVGFAMWYDTLVDASIFREWILGLARRDAQARIAHLLCEFGVRMEALGLGDRNSFELPMTQDQLADATGLTPIHVNRSLQELEARALITRTLRYVAVADWEALKEAADFDDAYLHFKRDVAAE